MAKFTELFIDYIKGGGVMPASFNQIEGFNDKFLAHYCDYEIGYETEELFKIKLELKANMVIPKYVERMTILKNYIEQLKTNPTKVHIETISSEMNMGAQKNKITELPIDALSAEPSSVNEMDEHTNVETRKHETKDYGASDEEAVRIMNELNRRVDILEMQLLDEFKPLFMGVY